MMRRTLWVVMALAAASLGAQQAAPRAPASSVAPLTLAAAVDSALRNSPDVLIARSVQDSARAEGRIARALPNPQLAAVPNTPFQYSATVPLDVGPQRQGRTRVSELAITAAGADARETARQIALAVARSYTDVLLADARRGIVVARREIVRQLVAADSARVRAGDLPERALIRSQVELIRADADLARAGIDAETSRFTLQGQMGIAHPDSALTLADTLAYRPVTLPDTGAALLLNIERRPDVAAARARLAQSAAAQQLAAAYLVPVPQISYVRQFGTPFESGRYSALGVGFELPIVNGYRGQRDRAAAGHSAAALATRRVDATAEREITVALLEYRAQSGLVRRYESGVIERVAQNVEATRYAYRRGAASLLEVLDALRAQQDVLNDYFAALHDYWVSVYALRAATGAPVP